MLVGEGGRNTKKEEKKVANEIPITAVTLAWLLGGGRGRSTVQETRPWWSVNGGGVVEEDNLILNGPIALAIVNGDAEALKIQIEQRPDTRGQKPRTRTFLLSTFKATFIANRKLASDMAFAPPKNLNSAKMQTKMSTWTPLNHQLMNDKVFEERRNLLRKWFDKWTDSQRRRVLTDFLEHCSLSQLKFCFKLLQDQVPIEALDFSTQLPRVLTLYIFSFLDPRSLSRCAQVKLSMLERMHRRDTKLNSLGKLALELLNPA
ncbi:F-box only protein 16 [Crotalus adamanteus]|uniref:F-box only protein 16 n=1 Tax=Crotalus adamanteus TaxID=8729 RepID=A0AAW1CD96_CROAD